MGDNRDLVERFVQTLDAWDWATCGGLLHPDVGDEIPQTRERIRGRERQNPAKSACPSSVSICVFRVSHFATSTTTSAKSDPYGRFMFTAHRRDEIRTHLLERARRDERIFGAAITGSAASGTSDRWSDIDLFFGVADGHDVTQTRNGWSDYVYNELGALHHFDLPSGAATYRAFLLADLLEIDLGFSPAHEFGPRGSGSFELVFGHGAPRRPSAVDADHLIGLAWHHVRHARTFIERDAPWQAEYWISAIRDQTLALASLRLGLPSAYAQGSDQLPAEISEAVREALVRSLDPDELSRALQVATQALVGELLETNTAVAGRLSQSLLAMAAG